MVLIVLIVQLIYHLILIGTKQIKQMNIEIKEWPYTQYCMECIHGEFIQSETLNSANYWCHHGFPYEPGEECQARIDKLNSQEQRKLDGLLPLIVKGIDPELTVEKTEINGTAISCPIVKDPLKNRIEMGMIMINRVNWTYEILFHAKKPVKENK